jgi:GLPGLI family protein
MKKFIAFTVLIALSIIPAFAQKGFEGTVKYKIEYEDLPEEMAGFEAMLPKEMAMKIKGNKSRTEQNTGMGTTVSISDGDNGTMVTLMDMMGSKVAIKMGEDELKKQKEVAKISTPKIDYLDETKDIAGYACKKAEITPDGSDESVVVYYTNEIQSPKVGEKYEGLKGFPMQYEMKNQGMTMIMTVTEVNKEKISKSEFTVPDEYEEMTMEEFQNNMGSQMMGE